MFFGDGFAQGIRIGSFDIQVNGYLGGAGITGGRVKFINFETLRQFPDQGVFAGAAA
jgi:hypothetical protein